MKSSQGMGAYADYEIDPAEQEVSVTFAVAFNAVQSFLWCILFVAAAGFAAYKRKAASRAWLIYSMLLAVLALTVCQTSTYLGYAYSVESGKTHNFLYGMFLAFFNLAKSAFLAVLLVVASGYCVTRGSLGPYTPNVIGVPSTVLVTGLVTDYTLFALQNNPNAKSYDLSTMTALAASLWFICSVLNLASLILAWMYTFEMLGKEIQLLEEEQQAFQRRAESGVGSGQREDGSSTSPVYGTFGAYDHGVRQEVQRLRPARSEDEAADDLEGGVGKRGSEEDETVADRLSFNSKSRLMSRFAKGVAIYLVGNIVILMLPIFVNHVVQSTLLVLQFVVYYVFMIVLLIIFRPRESSPYLMIGFSEQDAEERGVTSLATGIAMSDLPPSTNAMVGGGSSGNAFLQASAGRGTGERYGKLPALATTSADMRAYSTAAVAAAAPTIGASLMASEARAAAHQQQQQPGGAGGPPPALPVSGHALEPRGNAPGNASQQRLVATLQRPTPEESPFTLDDSDDDGVGYAAPKKYTTIPGKEA